MNAPMPADHFSTIDFASHLAASILLIASIAILRNKKSPVPTNIGLQLLCFSALLMQIATAAAVLKVISQPFYGVMFFLSNSLWVAALFKIVAQGRQRPVSGWLRLGAIGILAGAAFALLAGNQASITSQFNINAQVLRYGAYTPLILVAALNIYALRLRHKQFQHDCRLLLIGSLMFLAVHTLYLPVILSRATELHLLTYFHSFIDVTIALLFLAGSIKHPPAQAIFLSRKVVIFGSVALPIIVLATFFIIVGLFINQAELRWGTAAQIGLIGLGLATIYSLIMSNQVRDNIRVSVNKHFFRHKYDYRSVWLNLIQTLSSISNDSEFFRLGLESVGNVFNAHGGAMWLKNSRGEFDLVSSWNIDSMANKKFTTSDAFIEPLEKEDWIYALTSSGKKDHDRHLKKIPDNINAIPDVWIIAPLMIGQKLVGFFLLTKKEQNEPLIWEDIDVIKSAGKQLAGYIVRQQSAEQLAESKQFDTYNKLTAFIMHDLKNLIAQQALVVENAKKHKENPAFVEDAIRTIENSVNRMSQLLKRLQRNTHQPARRSISIKSLLLEAIRKSSDRQPLPTLRSESDDGFVVADQDQLVMILMHIIRNAQDATANNGFIDINVQHEEKFVKIEVEDNGSGMDEDFLTNRLFKPFESTKSSMGMGIGAYQVREFIQAMGGAILVASEVNIGTSVSITLPIAYAES